MPQRLQDNCALLKSKLSWSACEKRWALSRRKDGVALSMEMNVTKEEWNDIDRRGVRSEHLLVERGENKHQTTTAMIINEGRYSFNYD
jgi:hypothetical protein